MLVATAGHIDHGKTALIRALTGIDTDRLPEERARGISIDLGFAYWKPDDGKVIGFVDVPGHERFVRNMLAGVGAVDFALLVVAADDGIMPQSIEHAKILDLLGIARGFVIITKCDRASNERIAAVRAEVSALLMPTTLSGAQIFEVSAVTGAGLAQLAAGLRAANRAETPRHDAARNFRLSIDRAFSVTGVGTVVTGTVLAGTLQSGANLVLSPRNLDVRVRGLQSAAHTVDHIQAGERAALNLTGIELTQVARGGWLVAPTMHAPTKRIEVHLRVLPDSGALKHNAAVHLFVGTADIAARVLNIGQAPIAPDSEALVQLVLQQPINAVNGDRLILRDQSCRRLIGGGRIIDPHPTVERSAHAARALISAALQLTDPPQALAALLAVPDHEVDTRWFARCFNLAPEAARQILANSGAVLLGHSPALALPAARVGAITAQILQILKASQAEHPEAGGMSPHALKAKLAARISSQAFLHLLRDSAEKRLLESTGSLVKLPGQTLSFSTMDITRWRQILQRWQKRGVQPFTVRELALELKASEPIVTALLYRRRSRGDVWRITDSRFMLRQQVAALAATAAALAQEVGGKGFTAAQYRDAIGTGRGLAIQILEFFDSVGLTLRSGDLRKMRTDFELVVGSAAPYAPVP